MSVWASLSWACRRKDWRKNVWNFEYVDSHTSTVAQCDNKILNIMSGWASLSWACRREDWRKNVWNFEYVDSHTSTIAQCDNKILDIMSGWAPSKPDEKNSLYRECFWHTSTGSVWQKKNSHTLTLRWTQGKLAQCDIEFKAFYQAECSSKYQF